MSAAYLRERSVASRNTCLDLRRLRAAHFVIHIKLAPRARPYVEQVEVAGRIIALQEDRFRLVTDTGQVYLLTLGSKFRFNGYSLDDFRRHQIPVTVCFYGEPNLAGGVATQIRVAGR